MKINRFILQKHYSYDLTEDNINISKVLGNWDDFHNGWIASKSIEVRWSPDSNLANVSFGMFIANYEGVGYNDLYSTYFGSDNYHSEFGLYPVVSLSSSKIGIDVSNVSNNGSSEERAWRLIKK